MTIEEQILELVKQKSPDNPNQYVRSIVKNLDVQKLDEHILSCTDCTNRSEHRSVSKGNPNATLLIVGETLSINQFDDNVLTPLEEEDLAVLKTVYDLYNVNEDEIFYMNTVNCCPTRDLKTEVIQVLPNEEQVKNCKVFLDYAIAIVQPVVILLLGGIAINVYHREAASKARGNWVNVNGIPAMQTYHPNYFRALREAGHDEDSIVAKEYEFIDDIKKCLMYVEETFPENNLLLKKLKESEF